METLRSQLAEIEEIINSHTKLSEIMVNSDGQMWIEDSGEVRKTKYKFTPQKTSGIIRLLAGHYNKEVNYDSPSLSVKIPFFNGGRFQGMVPPIVTNPCFTIRIPSKTVFTLNDLLELEMIDFNCYQIIHKAIIEEKKILISGGTGSGKTTVLNAILQEIKDKRIISIEDNPEIKLFSENSEQIYTQKNFSLRDGVKMTLRLRPDLLVIGEVRDGATAIEMLKGFQTGHSGMGTIHASSAQDVEQRLFTLMQEVVVTPSRELIISNIDLTIHVSRFINKSHKIIRKVTTILKSGEKNKKEIIYES